MRRQMTAWVKVAAVAAILAGGAARAHDEPPKTITERREQEERRALFATLGVRTQQLFVTRPGADDNASGKGAESLLLTNVYDRAGNHLEQVVVDPAQAQRSVSRYAPDGTWLDEETWRDGKLSERTTFTYDEKGLVRLIVSEDLEAGTREELRYETSPERDGILVTKQGPGGEPQYTIRYLYEPGSDLARQLEAIQSEPDGSLRTRTRQTYVEGRRRTKEVYGADGALVGTFIYDYTPDGDFAQIVRRGPDGALVSRQIHTWRSDRLPATVTDHDATGAVTRTMRYAYEFFAPEPAGR